MSKYNDTQQSKITEVEIKTFIIDAAHISAKDKVRIPPVLRARMSGKTLEQIGKEVGKTRERIRQIEAKGCEIIRWGRNNFKQI